MKATTFISSLAGATAVVHAQSSSPCSSLELIVGRGTTEPGQYGVTIGDPLVNLTMSEVPGTTAYSVNYPANFEPGSSPAGADDVASHLRSQTAACPDQVYALIGYSQGAKIMYGAVDELDDSYYSKIIAVVQFGDPGNRMNISSGVSGQLPEILANRLRQNCAPGDPVCTNNGNDARAHLSYNTSDYISASADYIRRQMLSGGNAGPDPSPTDPGVGDNCQGLAELLRLIHGPVANSTNCGVAATESAGSSATSAPSASGALPTGSVNASVTASAPPMATFTGAAHSAQIWLGGSVVSVLIGGLLQIL